ncbi:Late embryogenesis abundant protein [Melia azedarach]|uniref:Late embryogenesis abundant protein n=1 Tax=Melia azedarach TaxID=155640 RepID=A0ACC1YGC2_MELAZ|nr:Late embryogenesis abundant protein [Melia azedarach]
MASMQEKTEEWIDSIRGAANSAEESTNNSAGQSANESAQQGMDQSADVIQQSGEKVTNMAQGAAEDAKNTLGMGQSNN